MTTTALEEAILVSDWSNWKNNLLRKYLSNRISNFAGILYGRSSTKYLILFNLLISQKQRKSKASCPIGTKHYRNNAKIPQFLSTGQTNVLVVSEKNIFYYFSIGSCVKICYVTASWIFNWPKNKTRDPPSYSCTVFNKLIVSETRTVNQHGNKNCPWLPFLARLAFRPCELLSSLFVRRLSIRQHFTF